MGLRIGVEDRERVLAVVAQDPGDAVAAYDGRETAVAGSDPSMFVDPATGAVRAEVIGGAAAAVPGQLRLIELAYRRHGKLPWADLFAPAIRIASGGFALSRRVAALALFGLVLPITTLVVGDAVLGAEVRRGSFSFTWLSPVPSWQIVLARWIGGTVVAAGSLSLAFAVAALVAGTPDSVEPVRGYYSG